MRKYELLGFFIIPLISILLALLFWALPATVFLDGLRPTTDSLWQVGKLMFFSVLIYGVVEYFIFGHDFKNFIFAKAATLFIGPIIYIGTSYLLDLGLGNASFNSHVVTYAFAVGLGQYLSYYIMRSEYNFKLMNEYAVLGIILMSTLFIGYGRTVDTFNNPIFRPMKEYQTYIKFQT